MENNHQNNNSNNIAHPHDKFVKKVMSELKVAHDIIMQRLPRDIYAVIEKDTLALEPGSFIDNELKKYATDILYSARIAGEMGYIYFLIEHQSQPDKLMPFRILRYITRIITQHLEQNPTSKQQEKPLPLVIPLVLYTGAQPYSYTMNINDLVQGPRKLIDDYFLKSFHLVEMKDIDDSQMHDFVWGGFVDFVLKYNTLRQLKPHLDDMKAMIKALNEQSGFELIKVAIEYIFNTNDEFEDPKQFVHEIAEALTDQSGENVMATMAQILREEGKMEGRIEGIEQGIEQGEIRGISTVALAMLKEGADLDFIAKVTKLSTDEIKNLAAHH